MDPALPFRQKEESQAMRPAITMSVVGGVLLLSAALAYGGGHIEAEPLHSCKRIADMRHLGPSRTSYREWVLLLTKRYARVEMSGRNAAIE
jgi:hypothetical protein